MFLPYLNYEPLHHQRSQNANPSSSFSSFLLFFTSDYEPLRHQKPQNANPMNSFWSFVASRAKGSYFWFLTKSFTSKWFVFCKFGAKVLTIQFISYFFANPLPSKGVQNIHFFNAKKVKGPMVRHSDPSTKSLPMGMVRTMCNELTCFSHVFSLAGFEVLRRKFKEGSQNEVLQKNRSPGAAGAIPRVHKPKLPKPERRI